MFSFAAIFITLLLFPALLCILILRAFFPKNTLRVNELILFSFGLALTLIFNLPLIFELLELLVPKCCIGNSGFESLFFANITSNSRTVGFAYLSYVLKPSLAFFVTVWFVKWIYLRASLLRPLHREQCLSLEGLKKISLRIYRIRMRCRRCVRFLNKIENFLSCRLYDTQKWIEKISNDNLVNYMGQMTLYHPNNEQLFVDVLDEGDSLYSGIFIEYFLDDRKFVGLKLSNVIRYSFKSDKERMSDGAEDLDLPYLLPNSGEMYFPESKIKNIHFWKLEKNHVETFDLRKTYSQIRFIWMFGIRYSLPHLNITPKGIFPKDTPNDLDVSNLNKATNTLKLNIDRILPNIEFEKSDEKSTS